MVLLLILTPAIWVLVVALLLDIYQFYWSFQRISFWRHWFFSIFVLCGLYTVCFRVHLFLLFILIPNFLPLALRSFCCSFSCSYWWKRRLLNGDHSCVLIHTYMLSISLEAHDSCILHLLMYLMYFPFRSVQNLLYLFLRLPLWVRDYLEMYPLLSKCLYFLLLSLLLTSGLILLWTRNIPWIIQFLRNYESFMAQDVVYLCVPCALDKNVCSAAIRRGALQTSCQSTQFTMSSGSSVSSVILSVFPGLLRGRQSLQPWPGTCLLALSLLRLISALCILKFCVRCTHT